MDEVYHFLPRWYSRLVPTERKRYQITETDEIARAIDAAAALWPGESRAKLAVRLIVTGASSLNQTALASERLAAIDRIIGSYPGYPKGYLADLRSEWPE